MMVELVGAYNNDGPETHIECFILGSRGQCCKWALGCFELRGKNVVSDFTSYALVGRPDEGAKMCMDLRMSTVMCLTVSRAGKPGNAVQKK